MLVVLSIIYWVMLPFLMANMSAPEQHRPEGPVPRTSTSRIRMPQFSKVTNRVEVVFDGAEPETAKEDTA